MLFLWASKDSHGKGAGKVVEAMTKKKSRRWFVLGKSNLYLGDKFGMRYLDAEMFGIISDDFPCPLEPGRYLVILEKI